MMTDAVVPRAMDTSETGTETSEVGEIDETEVRGTVNIGTISIPGVRKTIATIRPDGVDETVMLVHRQMTRIS